VKKRDKKRFEVAATIQNIIGDVPHIEMRSNLEFNIEGAKGVLEYDESVVRINTGRMVISLKGRRLNLKCLSPSNLVVSGFITGIEFVT
jgi:sporulation protein YqfC